MSFWSIVSFFATVLGLGFLPGCHPKNPEPKVVIWTPGSPLPPEMQAAQFGSQKRIISMRGETIEFSEQKWGPARIEGGTLHMIRDEKNELVFARADYLQSPEDAPSYDLKTLEKLETEKYSFWLQMQKLSPLLRGLVLVQPPQLTIMASMGGKAAYALDFLEPKKNRVVRYYVSPSTTILKTEIVSSDFDAPAWIYSMHDQEKLQEIMLNQLRDAGGLRSDFVSVVSASGQSARPENAPWKFEPQDPRFDQVQALYFSQKGIDFFRHELALQLPSTIELQTSFGYPDPTNAAFTYRNQIRLGGGDGIAYKSLAHDPSVVIHEIGHVAIEIVAHLPTQGEGGSLNEAFADFFAASALDDPKMGRASYLQGPYRRNLEDRIDFDQRNGGLYHDSQIVSGVLWEIRKKWGKEKAQTLALRCLARLGPSQKLADFPVALIAAAETLKTEDQTAVRQVLEERKWPVEK